VPSNTILTQTADALRDPRHPYRRALELACGAVEVVTIEEALRLSRAAVEGQTVVIVSTIQAFRTSDPTGRKVYDQNGAFSEHLLNTPSNRLADLLPGADGKPKPSLVNMLRLRRPVVIVDEAHNARTDLSFSTLGEVLPSCIIEFTATPAQTGTASNVLHRVSAAMLALDRFRLRDEIESIIQKHRDRERNAAYKQFLLPGSALVVDESQGIDFSRMVYEPSWQYEGGFQFQKHYFGPKPGELREMTPGGSVTEEFKCAQFLDEHPRVQYWMRNLVRKHKSFRLQTSTDWFYPDFVCSLTDDRTLVVEYKGKDRYSAEDADEKRAIGAVWASRSGGRCLFVMPTDNNFLAIASVINS